MNEHVQLMVTYIGLYRVTLLLPLGCTLSGNIKDPIAAI